MKILAIGNSFSEDATALLQLLAPDLYVRNLYIGGCSLERHCNEAANDSAGYTYQENGGDCVGRPVTMKEGLLKEKWDVITVQQVSGLSGIPESYYPYLPELLAYVRKFSDAEIVFHQTWAYEYGATHHPDFEKYGCNQLRMWEAIEAASKAAAAKEGLRLIPAGTLIAELRKTPTFDYEHGGLSLARDGYHLSINYGRYAAALAWAHFFTGKFPADLNKYASEPFKVIRQTAQKLCEKGIL